MDATTIILTVLWVLLISYTIYFAIDIYKHKHEFEKDTSWVKTGAIGALVNFFDPLGIGAFAPQTALLKFTKQTRDKLIPGTMNVANCIPVLLQAIIFTTVVKVEAITLVAMLISAMAGAVLGAGIVSRMSEKRIRLVMGFALACTAFIMFSSLMGWFPVGGNSIGLSGVKLVIAVSVNFILGALMTAGVGLYNPCMVLIFLLGMSPDVAFPIMMGSCAFLMPPASVKFIKENAYNRKSALSMCIFGSIATLIASLVIKSMPLDVLKWIVVAVTVYTSTVMLRAGLSKMQTKEERVETAKTVEAK
ncbi:sulfite exporter TauE/SafE family protein [Amedibacillus sp. YH-ame10]